MPKCSSDQTDMDDTRRSLLADQSVLTYVLCRSCYSGGDPHLSGSSEAPVSQQQQLSPSRVYGDDGVHLCKRPHLT